jgi:hypothetical protein
MNQRLTFPLDSEMPLFVTITQFPPVNSHSPSEKLLLSQEIFPGCDVILAAPLPARGVEKRDLGNFVITLRTIQLVSPL